MKLAALKLTDYDYLGFEQFFLVPDEMTDEEWVGEVEVAIASIPTSISVKHLIYKPQLLKYAAAELAEKWGTRTGQLWVIPSAWCKCPECGKVQKVDAE